MQRAVVPGRPLLRQRLDYAGRGIVRAVTRRARPAEHNGNALTEPERLRRLLRPDRRQAGQHVAAGDLGDGLRAEAREGVVLEGLHPKFREPRAGLPTLGPQPDHPLGSLVERRDTTAPRIFASGREPTVLQRLRARLRERDDREDAQPYVDRVPVQPKALDPVFRGSPVRHRLDPQREPVPAAAVAKRAGRRYLRAERRAQFRRSLHS